jgi:hypothetical protein
MLGPLEVRTDDGVSADVPGARLGALLIALALEPGRVVRKATRVDWIWDERPPSDAANALQRLVSRLRRALPDGLVEGQTDGYRLMVEPDAVDAVRFERLVGQARDGEDPRRVSLLREALALWRGAAMQDVGLQESAAFDAAVTRLEALRLTAMEDRFDAEVSLGHGVELVAELTDVVAARDLLGYLADDLSEARTHRVAACEAASAAGHAPLIARMLVGFADLALRRDQHEQAARLLAASAGVRGLPDRSDPDVGRIEQIARRRLGDARFAEVTQEGSQTSWSQLVEITLAS